MSQRIIKQFYKNQRTEYRRSYRKEKIVLVYVGEKSLERKGMVSELQKLDQQKEYMYPLRLLSLIM